MFDYFKNSDFRAGLNPAAKSVIKSTSKPISNSNSGFTLIEIIIVISLIAFVYSIAMPNFGATSASEVATKLGRLNADIRSAYDLSVLSGRPYRMVFELGTGNYWLEETETLNTKLGDAKIDKDPSEDDIRGQIEAFEEQFKEYEDLAGEVIIDPKTDAKITPVSPVVLAKDKLRGPQWAKVESLEWKNRTLGDGLIIKDMQAEHHQRKISLDSDGEDVRGFVYFLPSGYVEKAYWHIYYLKGDREIDEDKEPYTIQTSPWEGVGTIVSGYVEVSVTEKD